MVIESNKVFIKWKCWNINNNGVNVYIYGYKQYSSKSRTIMLDVSTNDARPLLHNSNRFTVILISFTSITTLPSNVGSLLQQGLID